MFHHSLRGQLDLVIHFLTAEEPSLLVCQIVSMASRGRLGVFRAPLVTFLNASTGGHQMVIIQSPEGANGFNRHDSDQLITLLWTETDT